MENFIMRDRKKNTNTFSESETKLYFNFYQNRVKEKTMKRQEEITFDGSVDKRGHPAVCKRTGTWFAGILILGKLKIKKLIFFYVK